MDSKNSVDTCWEKYGSLLNPTIEWFRKHGWKYREKPWREEFLYKYSQGIGLDLGSGIASTTREILSKGLLKRLVLVDLAETSLEKISGIDYRIYYVVSDIFSTPFPNNCFDTIYLLAVLHHIPGLECRLLVLRETYRLLKRDRYLIITVWNPNIDYLEKKQGIKKLGDREYLLISREGKRYYYIFSRKELEEILGETGYEIISHGFFYQNPAKPFLTRNTYFICRKP